MFRYTLFSYYTSLPIFKIVMIQKRILKNVHSSNQIESRSDKVQTNPS